MANRQVFRNRAELSRWLRKEAYKDEFKQAWALLVKAEQLMSSAVKADAQLAYPRALHLITGKAYKSYYSAVCLGRYGLTEDMGIVTRSLLNLDIVLKWISLSDREDRANRYLEWFWVEMYRLLSVLPAPADLESIIQKQYEKCKRLLEITDRSGKKVMPREWHNTTIKKMADEVDMTAYYAEYYKTLSATEHSSALSYFGMLSEAGPRGTTVVGLGDHRFLRPYLECAYVCFAEIIYRWNEEFNVTDDVTLDREVREGIDFFLSRRRLLPTQ
jgi:uncharacterized protein DUF5677